MTRLKKLLVGGLMVIVTGCVSLSSALFNVTQSIFSRVKVKAQEDYAYSNTHEKTTTQNGAVITVSNLPTEAVKNDPTGVKIPKSVAVTYDDVNASIVGDVIVLIKNPYGVEIVDKNGDIKDPIQISDDGAGKFDFTPTQTGFYTVQYAVQIEYTNGAKVWTVSDIYEINVTADSYGIDFIANDPIIMPSKIDTTQNVDTTVDITLPKFYDGEGELINHLVLSKETDGYIVADYTKFENVYLDENNSPKAAYDGEDHLVNAAKGKNIYQEYYAYTVKKVLTADFEADKYQHGVLVSVKVSQDSKPEKANNGKTNADEILRLNDGESFTGTQNYIDVAYSFVAGAGKNIVSYKLCDVDFARVDAPDAYSSFTIDGSSSYKKDDIQVGASTSSNIKSSSTSIEVKQYLPEVSIINKNENSNALNGYYYYQVAFVDEENDDALIYDDAEFVTMGQDETGVYFIPHKKGTYNIYYNAVNFYGKDDNNADDYDYDVSVTDRSEPEVKYVASYNPNDRENADLSDISYIIPSKYNIVDSANSEDWTKIYVPAVYAEDNFKPFNQLTIKRTLSSENGFINGAEESVSNFSLSIQNSYSKTIDGSVRYYDDETDFNAKNTAKNIDVANIISFENYNVDGEVSGVAFRVINNKFYKVDAENGEFIAKTTGDTPEYTTDKLVELTGVELSQAKSSRMAVITINPDLFGEGEYTIEYSIQDGVYSNNSGNSFTFTLTKDSASTIDDKAPVVKFGSSTIGNVVSGQKISVAKPSITDEIDTRLFVRYFAVANDKYLPLELDEDNNLVFNTADLIDSKSLFTLAQESESKEITVIALAYDDFATISNSIPTDTLEDLIANPGSHVGIGKYSISIKDVEDNLAPVVTEKNATVTDENDEHRQFTEFKVNGITFFDNTSSSSISVKVVDSKGLSFSYEELGDLAISKVETTEIPASITDNHDDYVYKYVFDGIKFTANKADNYTVTYTVVDGGNNIVTYSFVVRATTDGEAPEIEGITGTSATIELGETYYLKDIKSTDNKSAESDISYTFEVKDADNKNCSSWFSNLTKEFTPKAVGTYTITVTAYDEANNHSSKSFVISVKDTLKPTLELVGATTDNILIDEDKDMNGSAYDWDDNGYPVVTLPGFIVRDQNQGLTGFNGVLNATGTITVTTPDDDTYTIDINGVIDGKNPLDLKRNATNYNFEFKPTKRGHYTVSYVATDNSLNKSDAKTVNVYIGDTEIPVIYLTDNMLSKLNNGFIIGDNNQLVINPQARIKGETGYNDKDLYVSDNEGFGSYEKTDTNSNKYVNVTIEVVDSNNKVVEKADTADDDVVCYNFETAGTYTITFTVYDGVNNVGTLTKTFVVSSKTATTQDSSKVLSTVLLIVSIVILAGVVIYFVRGTKFLPKRNKKVVKKSEEKQENKD